MQMAKKQENTREKTGEKIMTREKMRRLITACVCAATVLFVLLLCYLAYQWITLSNQNKRIDKLQSDIKYYENLNANAENELDYYLSDFGMYEGALKLGFRESQGD